MQCRLCLRECTAENTVPIFKGSEEFPITKLIVKYLFLEIHHNDEFSTVVCQICLQHLEDFHSFFQFVEQRQNDLRSGLESVKNVHAENRLSNDDGCREHILDEPLLDVKYVITEHETNSSNPLQPTVVITTPQCERQEISCLIEKNTEKTITRSHCKPTATKKIVKKRNKNKISLPIECENVVEIKTKLKDFKHNDELVHEDTAINKNLTLEEEKLGDQLVSRHMQLRCDICNALMDTFKMLKMHFRSHHGTEGYIICCNKRFRQRCLFLDHIQVHLNPDYFRCKFCKKLLQSRGRLKLHIAASHTDREELKYVCNICNKKFAYSSNLSAHMLVHTDERNHICNICNKGFKAQKFLTSHMQVHAETKRFVCETCGREYRNKVNFERHMTEHQEGPKKPTEQCTICGKWFTDEGLQRHMECHNLKDIECKHCGKVLKSKVALRGHIEYVHRRKEVHACTFCEKTFKKPSVLKEHIAIHTGQKDYNCKHCLQEFRSKANMYAHIKKIHAEEWAQEQLNRNRGPSEEFSTEIKNLS